MSSEVSEISKISEESQISQAISEESQESQEYWRPTEKQIQDLMSHFPRLDHLMAETLLIAEKNNMLPVEKCGSESK